MSIVRVVNLTLTHILPLLTVIPEKYGACTSQIPFAMSRNPLSFGPSSQSRRLTRLFQTQFPFHVPQEEASLHGDEPENYNHHTSNSTQEILQY